MALPTTINKAWMCSYGFLLALFIYINYSLVRIRMMEYQNVALPAPKYKAAIQFSAKANANLSRSQRVRPRCCHVFKCAMEGNWVKRSNIGINEHNYIRQANTQLRLHKGWPTQLIHGDLRCGKRYPLPRVLHYNGTQGYYMDIISQCEPDSASPCCRDDVGWCGNNQWFCSCDTCIDYRQFIHAELASWRPIDEKCTVSKKSTDQLCRDLTRNFTSVTFIGDSLVRHVFSALLIQLTNDPVYGALKPSLKPAELEFCKEENQFVDSSCHVKLAMKWQDIQNNGAFCPRERLKLRMSFIEAYSTSTSKLALASIAERLVEPRPLVVIGIGIHDNFNATKIYENFLSPIVQLKSKFVQSRPVMIWVNTHASGPLKPIEFQEIQGNKQILKYNAHMEEFCRRHSIPVLDTFNMTFGVHSFDGTHYSRTLNLLKSTYLVRGIEQHLLEQANLKYLENLLLDVGK